MHARVLELNFVTAETVDRSCEELPPFAPTTRRNEPGFFWRALLFGGT